MGSPPAARELQKREGVLKERDGDWENKGVRVLKAIWCWFMGRDGEGERQDSRG